MMAMFRLSGLATDGAGRGNADIPPVYLRQKLLRQSGVPWRSDFGQGTNQRFTTFVYGHPRFTIIEMLRERVERNRPRRVQVDVADGAKDFKTRMIRAAIYATGWDGTVRIVATDAGS